ncbi:ATP-binding protein [Streptomyces axinellae]|uniref:ATPase n=1 Tax=Streptomyces axinellae TaxID=552788 RepID=A0ABN3Q0K6_9ACTN
MAQERGSAAGSIGPKEVDSPAEVRREVADLLREWSLAGHEDVVGDALLVASELASNAMLHAGGITVFAAELTDRAVSLHMSDGSREVPEVLPATTPSGRLHVGGHGWRMITKLARDIAVTDLGERGKRISVTVALTPPPG